MPAPWRVWCCHAARERLTGQVTARMRETLHVDAVLQTTVREMRAVLGLAEAEVHMEVELVPGEAHMYY